jgi:hypothetical protein
MDPDEDLEEEVDSFVPDRITKRMLWRVVQGQYDPMGLLSAYTVKFKLLMRNLSQENGRVIGWDEELPPAVAEEFKATLRDLKELREVTFPRSIQPPDELGATVGRPMLLMFGDGSREASCALAYARWQMADGTFFCRLIAGKTRVAPKCKISIPRVELVGSQMAVRLAQKVKVAIRRGFSEVRYFTDSTAVLGMLRTDSASLLEFVGTRVSEIKTKSDPETEWYWVPTDCNLADMGTRPTVRPEEMGEDSDYQNGMSWMRAPESEWPVKQTITPPPMEECRKDMMLASTSPPAAAEVAQVSSKAVGEWPIYPARATSLAKLTRIYGYVMWFLALMRKTPGCERSPMLRRPPPMGGGHEAADGAWVPPSPPRRCLEAARWMLLEAAQKGLRSSQLESLMAEKMAVKCVLGVERILVTVGGRSKRHLKVAYDQENLPVLPRTHKLARLHMVESHVVDHGGQDSMVMRSRAKVWIV